MRGRLLESRWMDVVVGAALLLPIVVIAARWVAGAPGDFVSSGDISLIELRVREISALPLLGPYSRFDVFHPGPWLLYLLAPGYWLTGAGAVSLHVSAALVNAITLIAALVVARQIAGRPLALMTAGFLLILMAAMGPERMLSPWNPSTNVPLFVLFFLSAWWLAVGGRWALPVLVASGTLAVQNHYGYVALVAVPAAVALALLAYRRELGVLRARGPLLAAVAVAAALWAPPLFQEASNRDPGNLRGLVELNANGTEPKLGWGDGMDFAARHAGVVPEWALAQMGPGIDDEYGRERSGLWKAPLLVLALVAACAFAWRAARRDAAAGALIALSALAAGVASLAQIRGELFPWLTWFLGPVVMLAWLTAAWCLIPARRALPAGAALVSVGAVLAVAAAARTDVPALRTDVGLDSEPTVAVAAGQMAAAIPDERVTIHAADADWGDMVETTALALSRHGKDVRVSSVLAHPFGYELHDRGEHGRTELVFVRDGSGTPPPPRSRVAARAGGYVLYRRPAD